MMAPCTRPTMPATCLLLLLTLSRLANVLPFQVAVCRPFHGLVQPIRRSVLCRAEADGSDALDYLKSELLAYLEKRSKVNADEEAQREVGKVVGGTKGNVILEYVSGAPNKEIIIEEQPNIFDYDQLSKYGYSHLVKPITEAGGRREMYKLVGMTPPPLPERAKPKTAPKLVIDKQGSTDNARYSGLKMGQVLDDEEMARALEAAKKKEKEGKRLRPKLQEEDYVQPFADKRNTGPRQTPDWTPEMLDEEGRKRGQAMAWARKAKAGELVSDPFESLAIEGSLRVYCIMAAILISFAFGRSSPTALSMLGVEDGSKILDVLQAPALAIAVAGIGSAIVSAVVLAPQKKRSQFAWAVKGFFGGPLAIKQLRELDELTTRGEE